MDIAIIYTTLSSHAQAQKLLDSLLEQKIVACGVLLDAKSAYFWEGAVVRQGEVVLVCKTATDKTSLAQERIQDLHPYDVPCILSWDVSANDAYAHWVREETR